VGGGPINLNDSVCVENNKYNSNLTSSTKFNPNSTIQDKLMTSRATFTYEPNSFYLLTIV
jgi:hypothetical protein